MFHLARFEPYRPSFVFTNSHLGSLGASKECRGNLLAASERLAVDELGLDLLSDSRVLYPIVVATLRGCPVHLFPIAGLNFLPHVPILHRHPFGVSMEGGLWYVGINQLGARE